MEHPHPLGLQGVTAELKAQLEANHPQFVVDGLKLARARTIEGFERIRGGLREGMSEADARKLALQVFAELGVTKHWHRPYVRFARGTTLTFNDPEQAEPRLQHGDPVYVDLGPVWPAAALGRAALGLEYEGDFGDSFVFSLGDTGGASSETELYPQAEQCIRAARALFHEAQSHWHAERLTGEALYAFLRKRAEELGYDLAEEVEGHRVGDFPHQKYSRKRLAELAFVPAETLWVLEVQLLDRERRFGAFFEDLL
jgi:hypothetical protein